MTSCPENWGIRRWNVGSGLAAGRRGFLVDEDVLGALAKDGAGFFPLRNDGRHFAAREILAPVNELENAANKGHQEDGYRPREFVFAGHARAQNQDHHLEGDHDVGGEDPRQVVGEDHDGGDK